MEFILHDKDTKILHQRLKLFMGKISNSNDGTDT